MTTASTDHQPTDTPSALLDKLTEGLADAFPGNRRAARTVAANLLAAHARALSDMIDRHYDRDRADHPSDFEAYHRRGGVVATMRLLDRYADDLDAASAEGAQR